VRYLKHIAVVAQVSFSGIVLIKVVHRSVFDYVIVNSRSEFEVPSFNSPISNA